jgi:malonyl CoA-acyl carrier protein transacylase
MGQAREAEVLADTGAHAVVYQVLDNVLGAQCVPTGARAALFEVVDELRAAAGGTEEARRAERISVAIHKLEWALRQADSTAAEAAREELKVLAAEWINMRICGRH